MSYEEYFPAHYLSRIESAPYLPLAEEAGLVMKRGTRLINTRLALSAAEFAREHGLFAEMHLALFKAYWEQTGEIGTIEGLKQIAVEVGLDAEAMAAELAAARYDDLLDANRREATQVGINGIPAHVFGLRYLVMGAHPYEVLKQVADKAAAENAEATDG
jgi:predicted DsbA family dithiol-disulfide isomerase